MARTRRRSQQRPAQAPFVCLAPVLIGECAFERYPLHTGFVSFGDDLCDLVGRHAAPMYRPGDWIALSEKVVSVAQNNARHISTVHAGWLARLIVKGVKKYRDDIGWERPEKMQVAVDEAGYPRMIVAGACGALGKAVGVHGVFWQIAGRVAEIDGFNPRAMYPHTEYAILPPRDPDEVVRRIEAEVGIPAAIIDGNNINVKVIAVSRGVPVDRSIARLVLLDNPMGQDNELTPIVLIRRVS